MASIKILLREDQPKKDGTYPVLIRVIVDRQVKYFSTGHSVKKTQFRDGEVIHHPDQVLINASIEGKRSALSSQILKADIEGSRVDVNSLSGKKKRGSTFFTAIKLKMETLEQRNQAGMFHRLGSKLKILKKIWGRDVPLADLSKSWVDKFVTQRLKDGVKISTIKKDLSDFSVVLNSIDFGGVDYFKRANRTLKPDPVNREKLSLGDIKLLEDTKLSGLNEVARDMFLFAFYAHGMRFESVATFDVKTIRGSVIRYRMEKGKKVREILIHDKLQKIIDKYSGKPYLFPVIKKPIGSVWDKKNVIGSANALINTHLKRVAIICGIEKNLSTHIARHSFATLSLKRKVSMEVLKDALGHSNFATTKAYLSSFNDDEINEAVKGLYD